MQPAKGTGGAGAGGCQAWPSWAAFILRCTLGVTFLAHAVQKIVDYGWSGGVPSFREWGILWPEVSYPLTVVLEGGGGLLLLLGLWVRPAAAALGIVMMVALFAVHLPYGFFLPGGVEFVLTLAACNAALLLLGPGRWAVEVRLPDASFERWLAEEWRRRR